MTPLTRFQRWLLLATVLLFAAVAVPASISFAQNEAGQTDADRIADEVLREQPPAPSAPTAPAATSTGGTTTKINILKLIWDSRWLMLPIIIMSIVVVAVGIERAIALRRSRVLPSEVVTLVQDSTRPRSTFSPKSIYRECSAFPSPLSNVVKSVLVKLGRPTAEVERIASETIQREADRLYRNVRSLNLAAAVTPLLGLLGTVWGMIEAFFATANLPVGANKAEHLAEGIYTALITTAGGLVVAIPAAILAHMFEGQIEKLFLDVHELVYTRLMPQAERLEGRTASEVAEAPPAANIPSIPTKATPPPIQPSTQRT